MSDQVDLDIDRLWAMVDPIEGDPHEGRMSESGRPDAQRPSTWESFHDNLRRLGLLDSVDVRRASAPTGRFAA